MSRDLTTAVENIVDSAEVQPFLLFEGSFASGYVRAWSGYGDLSWDSKTWTGTGTLLGITNIQETSDGSAQGITATLSGVPSALVSLALSDVRQGASGKVWMGFLDSGVVSDPVLLFEGRLDVPSIQEEGETSSISISYESRLIDLERPRQTLYTNEEQQALYAGDLGCEFVPSLQDITLDWGKK
jgi:hypothetical protein